MDWKLEVIVVPVSNVDRAKHFYSVMAGFNVDLDQRVNDRVRIVQLTPRGSGCSIIIGSGIVDSPPGSIKGLQLVVTDIDAARAELLERGVEVTNVRHVENGEWVEGRGGDWNTFIFFSDPDGNSWSVQERPAGS